MEKFLDTNLFKNCIMPLIIVFVTLYLERCPERKREEQEIKIKSFLLFIDIDTKIKNMQMSLRDTISYETPNNSLSSEQANSLLIYISKKLTIDDINIINMFYYNHVNIQNAVEKRKAENLSIKYELQKVASSYKCIYKNESMINCYNKLYSLSDMKNIEKGYNEANLNLNLEEEVSKAMAIVDETLII